MFYVLFFGGVMAFLSIVAWRDSASIKKRLSKIEARREHR